MVTSGWTQVNAAKRVVGGLGLADVDDSDDDIPPNRSGRSGRGAQRLDTSGHVVAGMTLIRYDRDPRDVDDTDDEG